METTQQALYAVAPHIASVTPRDHNQKSEFKGVLIFTALLDNRDRPYVQMRMTGMLPTCWKFAKGRAGRLSKGSVIVAPADGNVSVRLPGRLPFIGRDCHQIVQLQIGRFSSAALQPQYKAS